MPDLRKPETESDFYFVEADDPETAVARIIELVKTRIPRRFGLDPIRDVQVLCPMNRGGVGARSVNIELQAALNPAGDRKVERFGWTFAPGDNAVVLVDLDHIPARPLGDLPQLAFLVGRGLIDGTDPQVDRSALHGSPLLSAKRMLFVTAESSRKIVIFQRPSSAIFRRVFQYSGNGQPRSAGHIRRLQIAEAGRHRWPQELRGSTA
jgi:hypothetical protein